MPCPSQTKCLTFPQSALSYLEMKCDVTVTTLTRLCHLHLFSASALCASVKTPRYVVTWPFWHWCQTCKADLRAAAMEQICLFSVLSSASISTRPRYLQRLRFAFMLALFSITWSSGHGATANSLLLLTQPQVENVSHWNTQILSGRKKNWMRSWSPPRQEMRTLQPWKIH